MNGQKNRIGVLKQVLYDRKDGKYRFFFENGYTLVISEQVFFHHTLLRLVEEQVVLALSPEPILSGMLAYCLFETYGFPLEFAVDEMERNGMTVDEEGFHILESMARQRNKNTYKGKNAFGSG